MSDVTDATRLGANVKYLREGIPLSQAELVRRMAERGWPWHQSTVYRIESGRQAIRLDEAIDVAAILGATLDQLAGIADVAQPCKTCGGRPWAGFTCNECARSGS